MGINTSIMGCGTSTPSASPDETTAPAGDRDHKHRSGISGRGHGPNAPKAKQMTLAHFEAKIGTAAGFKKADDDNSGKLSEAEWQDLFMSIDTDGDGIVDQFEWEAAFGENTFQTWDHDHDGGLDHDEWKKIFEAAVAKGTIKKGPSGRTGISGR